MEVGYQLYDPATLIPLGIEPLYPLNSRVVSPRASQDVLEKRKIYYPCLDTNPRPSTL
jgi:hypothetical protein